MFIKYAAVFTAGFALGVYAVYKTAKDVISEASEILNKDLDSDGGDSGDAVYDKYTTQKGE